MSLKSTYDLESKFQPCFSSDRPIYAIANNIICGNEIGGNAYINLLDKTSMVVLSNINKSNEPYTTFAVCSNLNVLILATKSLLLQTIDIKEQTILKTWKSYHNQPVYSLTYNKSGNRLASGGADHLVRIWHVGKGDGFNTTCRHHKSLISLLRFHDEKSILFASALLEYDISVWDAEKGDLLGVLEGHQAQVTGIDFMDNVIATCGRDKVILLWNADNLKRINIIPCYESLESCIFIRSGPYSASPHLLSGGQSGTLKVWSCESRVCVFQNASRSASREEQQASQYTPASVLRLIRPDYSEGEVLVIRQSDNIEFMDETVLTVKFEWTGNLGEIRDLQLCGTDKSMLLMAEASSYLKLFPKASAGAWWCRLSVGCHSAEIISLAVSDCGKLAATGSKDSTVALWRICDEEQSVRMVSKGFAHSSFVTAVTFTRSSTLIVSAANDFSIRLWTVPDLNTFPSTNSTNIHNLEVVSSYGGAHDDTVNDVDISINDKFIASASKDKTARIWKLSKKKISLMGVLKGHRKGVWCISFSPVEKSVLTASSDGELRIWNLEDFSCMKTFEGHECPVYKALYITEGQQILSCDQNGVVRLWNCKTKENVQSLTAHDGRVWTMTTYSNGSAFYSGGEDATICRYIDVTETVEKEKQLEKERLIESEQEFSNLIHSKNYLAALKMAVKLDQPNRSLSIIKDMLMQSQQMLQSSLYELPDDSIQRVFKYCIRWNTNARNSWIAQNVLHHVLSRFPPETLLQWEDIRGSIEALTAYSVRHYNRICKFQEQMALIDFMCDSIRPQTQNMEED